jgi:hypothetical protein
MQSARVKVQSISRTFGQMVDIVHNAVQNITGETRCYIWVNAHRPQVIGDLDGEPIFKLIEPKHNESRHFDLQGFDISGAKGSFTV